MSESRDAEIVYFSSIFPVPWDTTKAAFSYQLTQHMQKKVAIHYVIPVPVATWFSQVLLKRNSSKSANVTLFPFFYIPKFARFTYPFSLFLSMCVCIVPLIKMLKAKHVIASWAYPDGVCAAIIQKLAGYQLTIECLGSDVNVHIESRMRRSQMLWAFKQAICVVTKSDALARLIKSKDSNIKTRTIYNGVNFERFKLSTKSPSVEVKLLFVGSMIKTKGIFELLESALTLVGESHKFTLTMVGKGEGLAQAKAFVDAHQLSNTVKILGALPHADVAELLNTADALILPSYREGLPNVMLEAIATGTPAIVTPVGGVPEILNDGKNGILLKDYQSDSIVEGIKRFSEFEWSPAEIRSSIAHMTWENSVNSRLELFPQLLNRK